MIAHFESVQALPEYQLVEMMGRMADCDMLLMQTRPYEVSFCVNHKLKRLYCVCYTASLVRDTIFE
jgi:hypothetical protein